VGEWRVLKRETVRTGKCAQVSNHPPAVSAGDERKKKPPGKKGACDRQEKKGEAPAPKTKQGEKGGEVKRVDIRTLKRNVNQKPTCERRGC